MSGDYKSRNELVLYSAISSSLLFCRKIILIHDMHLNAGTYPNDEPV